MTTRRSTKAIVGVIVGLVGFAGALIGVWEFSPLQRAVCESGPGQHLSAVCDDDYKIIPQSRADRTIRIFMARFMSSAGPGEAWAMTSGSYQSSHDKGDFIAGAAALYWEEEVGYARKDAGQFNSFDVVYRKYFHGPSGDALAGFAQDFRETMKLTWDGDDVVIGKIVDGGRLNGGVDYRIARPVLHRPLDVHKFPRTSSTTVMFVRTADHAGEIHLGGTLSALCNVMNQESTHPLAAQDPRDDGWWTRLPQGWIKSSAFKPASAGDDDATLDASIASLPQCDVTATAVVW